MNIVPCRTAVALPTELPRCQICSKDIFPSEHPEFAGKRVVTVLPCQHKFHFDCIAPRAENNLTCFIDQKVIEEVVVEPRTLPPNWQQQMINAAKQGDIRILQVLLKEGAAPDAGQTDGNTPLALALLNKHPDAALLLALSGASDPIGLNNLGILVEQGYEDLPLSLAESCYLKAADKGYVPAMSRLGYLYRYGGDHFPLDTHKAEHWFSKAADLGDAEAINSLKNLYQVMRLW